ncbi:MAG TPA: sigma-70 family RNA polymerase sigma factor [Candidatus Limnocylindrales bacterium]|jgi:RNA polymerase sigma-70 factor (ECF subfamily)
MSIDEMIERQYQDHAAAVRGKALQLTRDPELAADVTQEAFLRLFTEASAGRMPENVPGWLYRTSANLIVSGARHRAVAYRYAPRLVRDEQPAQPEAIALLREDQDAMAAALSRLAAPDRVILGLAAYNVTGREMATALGRSEVATRALLSRARGRLRTVLTIAETARAA